MELEKDDVDCFGILGFSFQVWWVQHGPIHISYRSTELLGRE